MNIMCWNCRGMGNPSLVRQLRKWCSKFAPSLLFLSETFVNKTIVEDLKDRFGFQNAFGVASRGNSGGLCLYWKEGVAFSLISYSQNHICGDVNMGSKGIWRFVGIYGWPRHEEKAQTWDLIRLLCTNGSLPLLIGGDFNEILSYKEKEGGSNNSRRDIEPFRKVIEDCDMRDLGFSGT